MAVMVHGFNDISKVGGMTCAGDSDNLEGHSCLYLTIRTMGLSLIAVICRHTRTDWRCLPRPVFDMFKGDGICGLSIVRRQPLNGIQT
jgi:hypothetical protein